MTETAKIELSNEEDTLESIAIAFGSPMVSDKFRAKVGQILENSEKYHGIFTLSDDPITTYKLSAEKLQEIRVEELKTFNSKILQAELKNQKLQKQFDVVKNELKESEKKYQKQMDRFLNSEMNETARSHCESQLKLLLPAHKAYEALAAIGGDGCPVGAVGKNGLTKEELQGSGDESY